MQSIGANTTFLSDVITCVVFVTKCIFTILMLSEWVNVYSSYLELLITSVLLIRDPNYHSSSLQFFSLFTRS